MKRILFAYLAIAAVMWIWINPKIDTSHGLLLPAHSKIEDLRVFPAFWWNFLWLKTDEDYETACQTIARASKSEITSSSCGLPIEKLSQFGLDAIFRSDPPPRESLIEKLNLTLAKASLPGPRAWLEILRNDPLGTHEWYLKEFTAFKPTAFPDNPLLTENGKWVALQFGFPAEKTSLTRAVMEKFQFKTGSQVPHLLGPHGSTLENENTIMSDLRNVTWVGSLSLLVLVLLAWKTRSFALIQVVPPLVLGIVISVALTQWIWGSIHGLTLSFGTAIIGLAIDYGIHAAFSKDREVWRDNFIGLVTTGVGIAALALSGVPIIRQMMVFSLFGLGFTFLFYRLLPQLVASVPEFSMDILLKVYRGLLGTGIRRTPYLVALGAILVSLVVGGMIKGRVPLQLSLQALEYRSPLTHKGRQELAQMFGGMSSISSVVKSEEHPLYIHPSASMSHAKSWAPICRSLANLYPLFNPFWDHCLSAAKAGATPSVRAYQFDFVSSETSPEADSYMLRQYYPETQEAKSALMERLGSKATDLRHLIESLSDSLKREIKWMAPLSVILSSLFLFLFYQNGRKAVIALMPFGGGLLAYFTCAVSLQWTLSFASLMGLVMVYGFSIDYGIFAQSKHPRSTLNAILFASLSNLGGFLPLLFCSHPVLIGLGQALVPGVMGSFLTAIYFSLQRYSKRQYSEEEFIHAEGT